jgi:DNA-binding XRE family transcriptional regulator
MRTTFMANKPGWKRGDFFLLGAVQFFPDSELLRFSYENHEVGEAPAHVLWNGRPGRPDWSRARVDPETRGALLVPTLPSGEETEIPSDVIRAATDLDYRAYVTRRAALWAQRVGRKIAELRESHRLTQQQLAERAAIDAHVLSAIEKGRQECALSLATRLVEAMGESVPEWLRAGAE